MAKGDSEDHVVADVRGLECYCQEHCPKDSTNNTCWVRPGGWCFKQIQLSEEGVSHDEPIVSLGCLPPTGDGGLMLCKAQKHHIPRAMRCCNDKPFCNLYLNTTLPPITTTSIPGGIPEPSNQPHMLHQIVLLFSVTVFAAAFILILTFFYLRHKKRVIRRRYQETESGRDDESFIGPGETLTDILTKSETSGSGSGLPLLVQRTIAKQVQLIRCVGKGRFGEVWKARWRGENVAVKIYQNAEEDSWFRETEIYQTVLMRHESIMRFVAADIRGTGTYTQLYLITEYHEYGSLYNFLGKNVLRNSVMVRLAFSAANGLTHLHTEICGMKGKPSIAHRDITSSNILVRNNGQCVIGDLALSARYLSDSDEIELPQSKRVGTRRYLAPEILDNTIASNSFEAYKLVDIYAFGLVLWEIARRCVTKGIVEECQLPYFDCVSSDPSFEDMRRTVALERKRPSIPNRWCGDEVLSAVAKIISECWHPNPAARLTSLRVKKSLAKLQENAHKV
ncbi:bone morphogenetic protein receptor type-1B-like [Apostichopus japonicus]